MNLSYGLRRLRWNPDVHARMPPVFRNFSSFFNFFFEPQLRHTLAAVEPRCACAHAASFPKNRVGDGYEQTQVFVFSVFLFSAFFFRVGDGYEQTQVFVFSKRFFPKILLTNLTVGRIHQ